MNSKIIKRYRSKSVSQLKKIAETHFNKFIRLRDKGQRCISCDSYNTAHASHLFSGGHHSGLKFNEDNAHASCIRCNYFLAGNLIEYRKKLINKIGIKRVEELDELVSIYKNSGFKWDKMTLIEIIETYKEKNKNYDN